MAATHEEVVSRSFDGTHDHKKHLQHAEAMLLNFKIKLETIDVLPPTSEWLHSQKKRLDVSTPEQEFAMKAPFLVVALTAALIILGMLADPASAELPPGTYEMLKSEAKEVLQLEVTKVIRLGDEEAQQDPQQRYLCEAKVTGIIRSASEQSIGNTIQFETYSIDPGAREAFTGPAIPLKMSVGWSGKVYLNPSEDPPKAEGGTPVYQLAAYGRSFETSSKARPLRQNLRRPLRRRRLSDN